VTWRHLTQLYNYQHCTKETKLFNTLDGRNPAPVDMINSPLFQGSYITGGAGFLPSTVAQNLS